MGRPFAVPSRKNRLLLGSNTYTQKLKSRFVLSTPWAGVPHPAYCRLLLAAERLGLAFEPGFETRYVSTRFAIGSALERLRIANKAVSRER